MAETIQPAIRVLAVVVARQVPAAMARTEAAVKRPRVAVVAGAAVQPVFYQPLVPRAQAVLAVREELARLEKVVALQGRQARKAAVVVVVTTSQAVERVELALNGTQRMDLEAEAVALEMAVK